MVNFLGHANSIYVCSNSECKKLSHCSDYTQLEMWVLAVLSQRGDLDNILVVVSFGNFIIIADHIRYLFLGLTEFRWISIKDKIWANFSRLCVECSDMQSSSWGVVLKLKLVPGKKNVDLNWTGWMWSIGGEINSSLLMPLKIFIPPKFILGSLLTVN